MPTLETSIKWLHSGGSFNKIPDYDLGGEPSRFDIAMLPTNNLFDDITPEEATAVYTDYRCFYIVNRYQDSDYDITLATDKGAVICTNVFVGSVVQNDIQKITFQGPAPLPDGKGYFICKLDWGPALTVYWNGSYTAMAADMQAKIRYVKYCSGVTVSLLSTFPNNTGATFQVTFAGQLQNRKMGIIKILENNLHQGGHGGIRDYRIDNTGATPSTWNYQGCAKVQVHNVISAVPSTGLIHIPYPYNDPQISTSWPYMHLSYVNFAGQLFNLQGVIPSIPIPPPISVIPISYVLGNNDECWVDDFTDDGSTTNYTVFATRIQEGSPINQLAQVIPTEATEPARWTDQGNTFHVGLIRPLEGFFVWVKRTPKVTYGCKDKLSISLQGQRIS